jgi:addiction module HigA family antidote
MTIQQYSPPHPGGFIKRVYLEPNQLGSNEVAAKLKVSPSTFNRLINEKSDVSPEMALKLSKVLGRSPESWLMMQDNYNLMKVKKDIDLGGYESIQFAI